MKIVFIGLEPTAQMVRCTCILTIQEGSYEVPVYFSERELYIHAEQNGRSSWENEDVVAVVSRISDRQCFL